MKSFRPYPEPRTARLIGSDLDRCNHKRRDTAWLEQQKTQAIWLPIWRYKVALRDGHAHRLGWDDLATKPQQAIFLGLTQEAEPRAVYCFDASADSDIAQQLRFADLRGSAMSIDATDAALLAYARAMVYWHRQHQHCGKCGTATQAKEGGHVLHCPACETEHYPRSDPSMLCLVSDEDDRALLGRKPGWPNTMFSVLAGFAEPGETMEDCVAREIWEEARIEVTGTRYVASQPWPFPASLLMGYRAQGRSAIPQTEQDELDEARWWSRDDVAQALQQKQLHLPPPFTLSFGLIEDWFNEGTLGPINQFLPSAS